MAKEGFEYRRGYNIMVLTLVILVVVFIQILRHDNITTPPPIVEGESVVMLHPQPFDPNTVELKELLAMGVDKSAAVSLLRFRAAGKIFRIREELIECYGVDDSLYFALEPYIEIGEEFRFKPRESTPHKDVAYPTREVARRIAPSKFLLDTVGVAYLRAIGALTKRQAESFVRWRDRAGIYDMEELRACYVVSDSVATALEPYVIFTPPIARKVAKPKVDLNRADSAELLAVVGIGERSVVAILERRKAIGGFHSLTQLAELEVITESNYEKIITQIFVDSCDISKIDINFASAKELSGNPYIKPKLRKLLKIRQLKGGWSTTEEMIEDKIFTIEEAQIVRPYLHFEVQGGL